MQPLLASDVNNTEYQGARNPDELLTVTFYWHEPIDKYESEAQGRPIKVKEFTVDKDGKAVATGKTLRLPYVRIEQPGNILSIVEVAVEERHKKRWPRQWLYWAGQEGLIHGEGEVPGWKIEEWTHLDQEQVKHLKYLRFSVVEQLAGASDGQIQGIGMEGPKLRELARQALRARMGAETRDALAQKDAEIAALKAADAAKEERLAKLEAALLAPHAPAPAAPPVDNENVAEGATPFPEADIRAHLSAQYLAKFGKKPHHKLGVEKIRAALG